MAFVVEDGTIVALANSYLSLNEAEELATDRLVDDYYKAWFEQPDAQKRALLIRATEYIDGYYGPQFKGHRVNEAQLLEFPRCNVYIGTSLFILDSTIIPEKLKLATLEVACLFAAGVGIEPSLGYTPGAQTGPVKKQRNKLDVMETETEFFGQQDVGAAAAAAASIWTPRVDSLLSLYVVAGDRVDRV